MTYHQLRIFCFLLILACSGCGYRFVDPFPASEYALMEVKNSTVETGLAQLMEEELRRAGGFKERSASRLSITITGLTETVDSVGSGGVPVRQELTMELSWKVEGTRSAQATFGSEVVKRSYPYSTDTVTLDWNRASAIRLLSETAAHRVLTRLGERP